MAPTGEQQDGSRSLRPVRTGIQCPSLSSFFDAGKDSKAKAQKALKAVKKGTWKQTRKARFSVVFHRPKTQTQEREPKYPRLR